MAGTNQGKLSGGIGLKPAGAFLRFSCERHRICRQYARHEHGPAASRHIWCRQSSIWIKLPKWTNTSVGTGPIQCTAHVYTWPSMMYKTCIKICEMPGTKTCFASTGLPRSLYHVAAEPRGRLLPRHPQCHLLGRPKETAPQAIDSCNKQILTKMCRARQGLYRRQNYPHLI